MVSQSQAVREIVWDQYVIPHDICEVLMQIMVSNVQDMVTTCKTIAKSKGMSEPDEHKIEYKRVEIHKQMVI